MKVAVFLHLFYTDLIPEILDYLNNLTVDFDLIVNTTEAVNDKNMAKIESFVGKFKNGKILVSENKGLDVGGYLNIINYVIENKIEYDLALFLHTKKHARTDPVLGKKWRRDLFNAVLGSEERVKYILNVFEESQSVGMIGSDHYILNMSEDVFNEDHIEYFSKKLDLGDIKLKFIGGSIFWTRWQPFKDIFSRVKIETSEFEDNETYKNDGMKAHAIERIFGGLITYSDLEIFGVYPEVEGISPENNIWFQQQTKPLEKYIELRCDLTIQENVYPAISIQENLSHDIFNLLDVVLGKQFGLKVKKQVNLKDLCLIKTKAKIKYSSDRSQIVFENDSLFDEYTKYSERFQSNETPSATYLIHPSVLEFMTNVDIPSNLYQLDGMRRIMSAINVGIKEIDAYVLIRRDRLKNHMPPAVLDDLKKLRMQSTWCPKYQEVIEFGLSGERIYNPRYTDVYDFSIMRDQVVVDFGGNLGQSSLESYFQGAKKIYNLDCQRAAIQSAKIMAKVLGATNIFNNVVDFDKPTFRRDILEVVDEWDWAIFQAMYREVRNVELFDFIEERTKKGIIFEGHADPKIDTSEYYQKIFKKYNFREITYLDHSQGKPAYMLLVREEWDKWEEEEFINQLVDDPILTILSDD